MRGATIRRWARVLACGAGLALPALGAASTAGDLAKAREGKRSAFVVVYDAGTAGVEDARTMAKAARDKAGKGKVSVVGLDRSLRATRRSTAGS